MNKLKLSYNIKKILKNYKVIFFRDNKDENTFSLFIDGKKVMNPYVFLDEDPTFEEFLLLIFNDLKSNEKLIEKLLSVISIKELNCLKKELSLYK